MGFTKIKLLMRSVIGQIFIILVLMVMVQSCSRTPLAVENVADMSVVIFSEPMPLAVGQGARFDVELSSHDDQGAGACQLSFKRMMPGMEMDSDQRLLPFKAHGGGRYSVDVDEFRMGGEWRLTIALLCQGQKPEKIVIDKQIPWPE